MTNTNLRASVAAVAAASALALGTLSGGAIAAPQVAQAGALFSLQGEASRTLVNDEATLTFSVERVKNDVGTATGEVVAAANAALDALKAFGPKAVAETNDFSTWPVYTRAKEGETPTIGAWGARQTIRVKVKDVTEVSKILEAAGKTMSYDGIAFGVSRDVQRRTNDELLAEAIADASARAVIAAKALGLGEENVSVEQLSVGSGNAPSVRYYAAARVANDVAMKAAAPAPAVSAGTSDVTLRVTMQVRIRPN